MPSRIRLSCRICGGELGEPIALREMMFGSGERFDYAQCGACKCLQIIEIPDDISRHYPATYYSFGAAGTGRLAKLKNAVRARLAIDGPALFFTGLDWWEKGSLKAVRDSKVGRSASILDLGCGDGELIRSLRAAGFENVLGADPFIEEDILLPNGVRVLKRRDNEMEGSFDLVMAHHSVEHMPDQLKAAQNLFRLTAPGGKCVVRIPTVDSWAWKKYGVNWVQLDAPRHLYLHSRNSIEKLLEAAGFKMVRTVDDSHAIQVLGSEKIERGLSLIDPQTNTPNYANHLPKDMINSASGIARRVNLQHEGDAIAVHVTRPPLPAAG
jgi:SAM-dependent methyltransferase